MSADLEQLEARLAELKGERNAVASTMTREDLVSKVAEYLSVARSHAAGSSRQALGGRASGADLESVLAEDLLDDAGLADRVVERLATQGFGEIASRQKGSKLKALDAEIAAVIAELREARRKEALEEVERSFANEAA